MVSAHAFAHGVIEMVCSASICYHSNMSGVWQGHTSVVYIIETVYIGLLMPNCQVNVRRSFVSSNFLEALYDSKPVFGKAQHCCSSFALP